MSPSGRTTATWTVPRSSRPPTTCAPWFLTTTGGVRCTEKMEVMNENNEIIEGLYCLGSMVGDMYCNCYSTHFPGHNLGGTCLTFGYLTGRQLAGAE